MIDFNKEHQGFLENTSNWRNLCDIQDMGDPKYFHIQLLIENLLIDPDFFNHGNPLFDHNLFSTGISCHLVEYFKNNSFPMEMHYYAGHISGRLSQKPYLIHLLQKELNNYMLFRDLDNQLNNKDKIQNNTKI